MVGTHIAPSLSLDAHQDFLVNKRHKFGYLQQLQH
jgi:hypothetical protein